MQPNINIKTTVINSIELTESSEEKETDLNVRVATKDDFDYFNASDAHSPYDCQVIQESDICVVAREEGDIIHHTCVALDSLKYSRSPLTIELGDEEAYIYNVWTESSHRGRGIFRLSHSWVARQLYDLDIRTLFSEIDSLNTPSLKAFNKIGYNRVGERYSIESGESTVHMIIGRDIYSDTINIKTMVGNVGIAKTSEDRFSRIKQELAEYIEKWSENDREVVLFGTGNHAQKIVGQTDLIPLVRYAVDEDSSKVGSEIPGTNIPIYPLSELSEQDPDVIIICSEAFQNDMATRAKKESNTAEIIVLYPQVSQFDDGE